MRFGLLVGFKQRIDDAYRFVMLALMLVELGLLAVLVWVEVTRR